MLPPPIQPGDAIAVIAPSGPIRDSRLERGMEIIRRRGYRVLPASHLHNKHGFLAGTDRCRAADINAAFADPDIRAVFCARGGYGAMRLLPFLDWSAIAANPKPFVGFSDITTLHLALERHTGMITYHGPVVTTLGGRINTTAARQFWQALEQPDTLSFLPDMGAPVCTLSTGTARGRLAGGCISLLCSAVGTPEQPDFEGRIVVLEDVGEPVYRVDRMLLQLDRAGLLASAAGFVIGTVSACDDRHQPITLADVWRERIGTLGKPAVTGFPIGHIASPLTLPLGAVAELCADTGELRMMNDCL